MSLKLYKIDLEYIKFLHFNYDNRVQYNQARGDEYNSNRPYVGVVIKINGADYYAPLEHPRPEHQKLKNNPHIIKIIQGKYGLIGLNNMIPVHKNQLINFDINKEKNKTVLITQMQFCQDNFNFISERANKVYINRTQHPNSFEQKIYCDFKLLEQGLKDYCLSNGTELTYTQETKVSFKEKVAAAQKKADKHNHSI